MVKKQKEAAAEKIDCKNEEKKEPIIEEKKEFTNKKNKKIAHKKLSTNDLLEQINFSFSRDAVWFKKTLEKIDKVKSDLDQKFYNEQKRKEKIAFINKLRDKIKDYKDSIKFAEMYKKIRFFERRKLERMLKKINKQIEENKNLEESEKLKIEKERIVDDINYVKFFPKSYKYLSLLSKKDLDNEVTNKKREKMRGKIKMYLQRIQKTKEKYKNAKISQDNVDYENQIHQTHNENKLENDDFFLAD